MTLIGHHFRCEDVGSGSSEAYRIRPRTYAGEPNFRRPSGTKTGCATEAVTEVPSHTVL